MNNKDGNSYYGIRLDHSKLGNDAAQSRDILHSIGKTAEAEGERIDKAFNRIGAAIVGVFSIQQAKNFAQQVVSVRGEIQSLEKSFEILAGKDYGRRLFADIRSFAVNTPMQMNDLAKGAQTLLSFNVAAKEVMPILRAIGDISMGEAQKFNSLTLAFSQMSSTGKLMGQDLLQMINAGFNPLAVISEKTGKSIGVLKKEMEDGAISAEMVKKAFMDAAGEGGKFNGMLEQQSKGIKGAISNLQGAIDDMFNDIGKNSEGIIAGSIQAATDLVKSYERVGQVIGELIATYGVYKAALIALTAAKSIATSVNAGWTASELLHYNALLLVEKAQRLLNATILNNPYVLAAAAVAALAYGIYKLVTYQTDAEKAQERLNKATSNMNKEFASERVQIDSLFARLKAAKEGTDEYKSVKQAILNQYGDYLKGLSSEIQSLADVEAAYKAVTKAAQDAAKARAFESATKEAADVYAQKEADAKDKIYKALKDKFGYKTGKDGIALAETYYWQLMGVLEGSAEMTDELKKVVSEFDKQHHVMGDVDTGIGAYDYTTNKISDALSEVRKAKAIYDNETADARRRFGDAPKQEAEEEQAVAEIVKNKKYWEDYQKEQQGLLDAMTDAQLKTAEAAKIRKNIADAQAKIDAYSVSKGATASAKETRDENSEAGRAAARRQKLQDYADDVSREARQAELDIEQARIDGMKEGLEKELAQNELNYQRLVEANRQRQEEMVRALADAKELEWENANPKAKEQGQTFDRSTVTAADLSSEQQAMIREYARIAEEIRQRENRESLEKMLADIRTYEQSRQKIEEEYARKRESMYTTDEGGNKVFRAGVSQGNVDELNRQAEEALKSIDEQFAAREETYQAWCNEIATLSLRQLEAVLKQAEEELRNLEKSGTGDSKQLATARAKVATAQKAVSKAKAEADVAPNKRSIKEWEDLYKVLNECNQSFKDIGDTVGGVAGEIISAAGGIMTSTLSMINGIVQLVNMSATGMQATAAAGATAISTMEKASVILTVISAALQVAMAIVNLFNNDEKKQKEIEALQERIDQLQWELDNADAVRLQNNVGDAVEKLRNIYNATTQEVLRLHFANSQYASWWAQQYGKVIFNNEIVRKSVEKIADAYANVAYTADKALGEDKYANSRKQLENLAQQQVLIQKQINEEQSKKKTDNGKIQDWKNQIAELAEEMATIINEMLEDAIGYTAENMSNTLSDAFFDAAKAGEDAMEAWHEKVNDIVADIIQRMLVTKYLEPRIGEIFDKYKAKWFPNGDGEGAIDRIIASANDFAADLNAAGEEFGAMYSALSEGLKGYFGDMSDAAREASQKGIAQASQESIDELNGRATAIQGHTFSINENTKQLVITAGMILESVLHIEEETNGFGERLGRMEASLRSVQSSLDDIALKGIKIQ